MVVGDGRKTRFWQDVWSGGCSFMVKFPHLFKISSDQAISVAEAGNVEWRLQFRRNLGRIELEWATLQQELSQISLTDSEDAAKWGLEKKGIYSTRSLYRFIVDPGVICRDMVEMWRTKLPLKIQILWMIWQDRLQTAVQLKKRKWDGPKECKLCNLTEDTDHLLFCCPPSTFIWCWVRDSLGWSEIPTTVEELLQKQIDGIPSRDNMRILFYLFAGVAWAIWRTRNDWVFENKLISNPKMLAYKVIGFLRTWSKMASPEDQDKRRWLLRKLEDGLEAGGLRVRGAPPTDS
ncbi:hypothetical protein C2845_PM10G10820 [Panicum miliaceum]|uniref:Reverse transcriptase zinc-binding domain-containing protein n=1 Tax=Panicum miliaceum TaxID=4540 RepID=A0A3L6PEM2_PANMI|nr:hypothetical protein C2845_PM10G10820 [Panicum miliaceum]